MKKINPATQRDKCGTLAGYSAHKYYKEETCASCKKAKADYARPVTQAGRARLAEKSRNYYAKNKEKAKISHTRWLANNKEKVKETDRRWKQANKDKTKASDARKRAKNPIKTRESMAVRARRRRARIAGVKFELYTVKQVLSLNGSDCHICKQAVDLSAPRRVGLPGWERGLHMDHVIPIALGGDDILTNVKPSHGLCNLKKNASIAV